MTDEALVESCSEELQRVIDARSAGDELGFEEALSRLHDLARQISEPTLTRMILADVEEFLWLSTSIFLSKSKVVHD